MIIQSLRPKQKKEFKELMKRHIEIREKQLEFFEKLAKPIKDNIKISKMVLKDERPIEYWVKHNEKVNTYLKKLDKQFR